MSADACSKLFEKCQLWQEHCVLLDKITRCLQQLRVVTSDRAQNASDIVLATLSADLQSKRRWDYTKHPYWLAFEVLQRIQIWPPQYTVGKQLLANLGGPGLAKEDRGVILQVRLAVGHVVTASVHM